MLNVGLTGGIGCGKSTVAGFFLKKGAFIIDFDTLAHTAEALGSAAWKEIVKQFGTGVLNEDNTINRPKLGEIVFHDSAKREALNRIVHPAVFDEWKRSIETIRRKKGDTIIISDIPLLIEVKWCDHVDCILLIYLSPEEQIRRIMNRNNYTHQEALARLGSQMPIDEKLPYADFIINNEGSEEKTEREVDRIWRKLVEMEKRKPGQGNVC